MHACGSPGLRSAGHWRRIPGTLWANKHLSASGRLSNRLEVAAAQQLSPIRHSDVTCRASRPCCISRHRGVTLSCHRPAPRPIRHQEEHMGCTRRIFTAAVASVGALPFVGAAFAAHQHQAANQLLGNKTNTDGTHEIHKRGDHTIHAHVKGKKIERISVTHRTKGAVAVKKYKTNKKVVALS